MTTMKMLIQTSPTKTQLAMSDFQTRAYTCILRLLLLTDTHLQERVVHVPITLSYSPPSMLHPQVIYTIAFSAGINGLLVDYM